MTDQATKLRRLVADTGPSVPPRSGGQPHVVAVTAGKGGVGTTTIAMGLAAALASEEQSTLLVDGNTNNPDIANVCGIATDQQIDSCLFSASPWGPPGMHVAARPYDVASPFIDQLRSAPYDVVVVDAGSGINRTARGHWRTADQIILVTGEDAIAAMDAYAAVKLMAHECPQPVSTLINGTHSTDVTAEIHQRIAQACHRFLGRELLAGGYVPRDPKLALCAAGLRTGWSTDSSSDAILCFRKLAHHTIRVANAMRRAAVRDDELQRPVSAALA